MTDTQFYSDANNMSQGGSMYVLKRNGNREPVKFDKITRRIEILCDIEPKLSVEVVDPVLIAQKVISGVFPGVKTSELDNLAAETAAAMSTTQTAYGDLAARIAISNLQKQIPEKFSDVAKLEFENIDSGTGESAPLLSEAAYQIIHDNADTFNNAIKHERDFQFDYFGFKTLQRSYLFKVNKGTRIINNDGSSSVSIEYRSRIVETPQYMMLRVAIGIHMNDIAGALHTYDLMSGRYFTHATPTLFNAATPKPQMSSCYLLTMTEDSIDGIYDTLKRCALISKAAGGIGLSVHCIRSANSYIRGTNGTSNGLVPMLRVYNDTARYVDQCFYGSSNVITDHGPKPMAAICAGDKVLTHLGRYQTIQKLVDHAPSKEPRKMVRIYLEHALSPIEVTNEHQFLSLQGQENGLDFSLIKNRLGKGFAKLDWIDAKDLVADDFLCFPVDNDDLDNDWTDDDCRFYGLLCGDGWISRTQNECRIYLRNDDVETTAFVETYLTTKNILWHKLPKDNGAKCAVYRFSIPSGFFVTSDLLYNQVSGDKIIHDSLVRLPLSKTLHILKGLIESNGCIGTEEVTLEMTSADVIQRLRFMLARKGILTSGARTQKSYHRKSYMLRIPRTEEVSEVLGCSLTNWVNFFRHENYLYSRIQRVEETESETGKVLYDLEVEEDHSYVTDIGIVHNGGGKRKGAFAVYLEPWHSDIYEFLDLKKNTGKEENRARDLFYALWIPDLFMKRVENNENWTLFCPNEAKGLDNCWGEEFEKLYTKYESTPNLPRRVVKAQELWFAIIESQIETGTPYMLYKDSCNRKSNQQNLGTIKSSNLCCEIIEYTSPDEVAVCNLGSLCLPMFVKDGEFDHRELFKVTAVVTRNLNKIIDGNYYPIPEARKSNMRHRPIGLGVQGLADVFIKLRLPFESPEAQQLNKEIFETIYFAAMTTSKDLAKELGPYETYQGCPVSKGIFQYDMWGVTPTDRWDWKSLKAEVAEYGIRNSLLVAPMPTASTAQIMGNNEAFEPYTSNMYTRRVLAGDFAIVNRQLVEDLTNLGLWTADIRNKIVFYNGSIQNISDIPQDLKELYKTVWEISQRTLINMAADRGAFVCQSQSFNVFIAEPNFQKLTSMHFYAWKKGLKTGMYYLRTRPAADAIKFTVDQQMLVAEPPKTKEEPEEVTFCTRDSSCLACGA